MAAGRQSVVEASEGTGAGRSVRLRGRVDLASAEELWRELHARLRDTVTRVEVDLGGVEELEGSGAALLLQLRAEVRERGGEVEFVRADDAARRLLELHGCPTEHPCLHPTPASIGILDNVGRATVDFGRGLAEILAFVGDLVASLREALRRPRTVHWRDLPRLMEGAGADGVPIVLLINFLVGAIMALQAATQLERFGAEVLVADLVGLSMTRELAPLMTAIVVAGRSGAAFAAELGTMRVSEEVDALRVLGLDPQRHLVFPRVIALAFVVPLLTLGADVVGCLGGLFVGVGAMDLPAELYLANLQEAVGVADVVGGLVKSVFFAATITFIACQRGLAARGGAAGVGSSTTTAVVATLFALIVLDALFTMLFNALGV